MQAIHLIVLCCCNSSKKKSSKISDEVRSFRSPVHLKSAVNFLGNFDSHKSVCLPSTPRAFYRIFICDIYFLMILNLWFNLVFEVVIRL